MSVPTEDRDLREAFGHLRLELEDPERVPPFLPMIERARLQGTNDPAPSTAERRRWLTGPPFPWLSRGVRAGLAAAAVAGILLTSGARDPDREFQHLVSTYVATSPSLWRSPTSRLLDVPGLELVRSVPAIGIPVPGTLRAELPDPTAPTRESPS